MGLNIGCEGQNAAPVVIEWGERETLLYNVGIGSGLEDPGSELHYSTENSIDVELQTIPTMAGVLGRSVQLVRPLIGDFPSGIHARQTTVVESPIPVCGRVTLNVGITKLYDLGRAALVEITATGDQDNFRKFCTVSEIYIPNEGGFGGVKPEKPNASFNDLIGGEPNFEVSTLIPKNQALYYRLTGDRNPLHADPQFAKSMGFEKPILHGMCTYGFAARMAINEVFSGEPSRMRAFSGKFTKPLYPGSVIFLRVWESSAGAPGGKSYFFEVTDEAGDAVISEGYINHL